MIHDLVPVIPDASLLGVGGGFAVKAFWRWRRQPSFWPEVVTLSRTERYREHDGRYEDDGFDTYGGGYYDDGWRERTHSEEWIVVHRKAFHDFPPTVMAEHNKLWTDAPDRYLGIARLTHDMDEDALTDATARARSLSRTFCKLEAEPTTAERAKRLLQA